MIKKYEVENIIRYALEELDGKMSKPRYDGGLCTIYESSVSEDENGDLIFSFKEDILDKEIDKYRIKIEYMSNDHQTTETDDKINKVINKLEEVKIDFKKWLIKHNKVLDYKGFEYFLNKTIEWIKTLE